MALDPGLFGQTSQASGGGVVGVNVSAGPGVMGIGNSVSGTITPSALASENAGGAFAGTTLGLFAQAVNAGGNSAALSTLNGSGMASVNAWVSGTNYKIIGNGTVSTLVRDPSDSSGARQLVMHAPETPEIYLMDFGEVQMTNGFAHVDLDPTFASTVQIDESHPLRVFATILDDEDSIGITVKNRTAHGFDIVERRRGRSNMAIEWQVVCNRADEVMADGRVSYNADRRFEPFVLPGRSIKPMAAH